MKFSDDGTHLVDQIIASPENVFTWVTKPAASEYTGSAWFSDIEALGYSDGLNWTFSSIIYSNPFMPVWHENADNFSGYPEAYNNATVSDDYSVKRSASKTIKFSTPSNSSSATATLWMNNKSVQLSTDLDSDPILICLNIDHIPANESSGFKLWISAGNWLADAYLSSAAINLIETIGWQIIPIDKRLIGYDPFSAHFIKEGTNAFDFSSPLVCYRPSLVSSSTISREIYLDSILEGYKERPKVCITFDDNNLSSYTIGYKEAKKRNIKTSHFLIYDLIDQPGHTTLTQNQYMKEDTLCYMGLHGRFRFDGAGSGAGKDPYTEMLRNIVGLMALGISDCKYMAWPEGEIARHDRTIAIDVAKRLNIAGARSTLPRYQYFYKGCYEPLNLSAISLSNGLTLANAKIAIDTAIAWGCSVTFFGHKLADSADSETWTISDYISLLDYIATKKSNGLIDDMKFDELCKFGDFISKQ